MPIGQNPPVPDPRPASPPLAVRPDLGRYAILSIGAALTTMALKAMAWLLTGSVGFLSDALESTVNLVAAVLTLVAVRVAARPPDAEHEFGHDKAEFFSAGAEGIMIVVAGALMIISAVDRILHPRDLSRLGLGLAISIVAALVNLAVALILDRTGKRHQSIALVADAHHLLTDVWTSAGVVVAVALVAATGQVFFDWLVALVVGANVVVTGVRLLYRSGHGLMDPAFPAHERERVLQVLARFEAAGVRFHALRTRTAGPRRFLAVHVLVPGSWTVQQGHDLVEEVEADLRSAVPNLTAVTHLEPLEDPRSYRDAGLDRADG